MSDVIDRQSLMENIDGDIEFLAETVEMLDEDGPDLLAQMRVAIAGGNCAGLAMAAHTYKGMVGNFCAGTAQQAALELEMMGRNAKLAGAEGALRDLEAEAARLKAALGALLEGGPA